jgi:dipeptidyl aminopeptidase/acylaminoacyl peptidase
MRLSSRQTLMSGAIGVLVATLLATTHAQQRTGRALTIEDYYHVQTVGSPSISPDGRWVSFTVATRIEQDNSTRTELHVVPSDGSTISRRILHYGKDVTDAAWRDDGRLQYTADRQQWTLDLSNPATPPATIAALPNGAVISKDKAWMAFAREKAEAKKDSVHISAFEQRHEERFKGLTFDWKDFQRDGQPFPAPNLRARPAAELVVQQNDGSMARALVSTDIRPTSIAWHPEGKLLAYVADPEWRDELKYESPDLWTVTTDGQVTRLTDDGYVYSEPAFSPDGRYLSYVRTFGTDMIIQQKLNHGGPRDLYIRPLAGGDPVNLTASWDLEPDDMQWSPDSRYIYFTAQTGGESHLFRVGASPKPSAVEQITKGARRLGNITIDRDFKTIAYTIGLLEAPAEVHAAHIDGTNERRLTHVHDALLSEVTFSKAERLQWSSKDGTKIEGWLMAPYGYDAAKGPYPLIVTSHGGPHSATGYSFDFKKQYFAAHGYFVLDTNFRSSTGYGDAFKWATWGAWGDRDGEDVISGLDYVLKHYPIDARRVGHTGHSYGGFMTNWLITQYPDRFAAAITGAGITNWTSDYGTADIYRTKETEFFGTPWDKEAQARMMKQSPLTYAGNVKTPTLFVHGEVDQRVPYEEGEQMYFALRRRGIPAKMIQYAGQPHGIAGHWNNVHRMLNELKWWNTYLKPLASTTSAGR